MTIPAANKLQAMLGKKNKLSARRPKVSMVKIAGLGGIISDCGEFPLHWLTM